MPGPVVPQWVHREAVAVTSNVEEELEKLRYSVKYGADTVMDLSTGGDIPAIRQAILNASPVPIGTVPIYEASLACGAWRTSTGG